MDYEYTTPITRTNMNVNNITEDSIVIAEAVVAAAAVTIQKFFLKILCENVLYPDYYNAIFEHELAFDENL
jgi:hypothetical protein